jgi:hypothetical protein
MPDYNETIPGVETQPDLWATYWLFPEEGMDDILEQAGESLDDFLEKFNLKCVKAGDEGDETLFLARYELRGRDGELKYPEAIVAEDDSKVLGFVDFLNGFPYGDVEMMGIVGELSTKEGELTVVSAEGEVSPPVPDDLFEGIKEEMILHSYLWLAWKDEVDLLADNLEGEDDAKNPHWWLRWNIIDKEAKYPTPGEMLFLAVRLFPTSPWGDQGSSPFLMSGNWMDTLYYSSGVIIEVNDPVSPATYKSYTVRWRGQEITARPSDFTEYEVDDRVAILKRPDNSKETHTWKMKDDGSVSDEPLEFDKEHWVIAPITFYEKEPEE